MISVRMAAMLACAAAALGGCTQNVGGGTKTAASAPVPPKATQAAPTPATPTPPSPLSLQAINAASFTPPQPPTGAPQPAGTEASKTPDAALIKAEVLLDRSNFAPGVIDGQMGENVHNALIAYDKNHGLTPSGTLDQQTWDALNAADHTPVLMTYTITSQDVAGPWTPNIGENFVKMAQLKSLGYTSELQMLAARFHMDQGLLTALNPGVDLSKPGGQIVVVDPGQDVLPPVDHIVVDKATKSVTAYGASNQVVAVFPATVGSTERPSPKGTWKVKGVAQNPDYTYDPSKLTWGPKKAGKLHIPPGPNNPVGVVWIALSAPDYGIHGTPDPHVVGKTASHGCVRLTNWDAEELSKAVKPGVKVTFVAS
jgi:lipoprotein-anchoring transpeptidase ErfK/SrfK